MFVIAILQPSKNLFEWSLIAHELHFEDFNAFCMPSNSFNKALNVFRVPYKRIYLQNVIRMPCSGLMKAV